MSVRGAAANAERKPRQQPKSDEPPAAAEQPAAKEYLDSVAEAVIEKEAVIDEPTVELTQMQEQAETLKGDLAKAMLAHMRRLFPSAWKAMSEHEQKQVADACVEIADTEVKRSIQIVVARGFHHINVRVGKFSGDDKGLHVQLTITNNPQNLLAVGNNLGRSMCLVPLDEDEFMGGEMPRPDVIGTLRIPDPDQGALDLVADPVTADGAPIEHDPVTGEVAPPPPAVDSPPDPAHVAGA